MTPGKCRYDITLRPISGKAIPLYVGEVMRIIQVEGEQCVDFNCFNLHDYKERMSVGHMRLQGFRVGQGHIAVSAPPRYRPMLAITHMAPKPASRICLARAAMPREVSGNTGSCRAPTVRTRSGKPSENTASHRTMCTTPSTCGCTRPGEKLPGRCETSARRATMSTFWRSWTCSQFRSLAARATSARSVISDSSRSRFKSTKHLAKPRHRCRHISDRCTGFTNQRKREDLRINKVLAERKLRPVPGYQPQFRAYPIELSEIEVGFTGAELQEIGGWRQLGGQTDEDIVRAAFMLWYQSTADAPALDPSGRPGLLLKPRILRLLRGKRCGRSAHADQVSANEPGVAWRRSACRTRDHGAGRHRRGRQKYIYLSGQVSRDVDGKCIGAGDMRAQMIQVGECITAGLKAAGATMADVVKTTTFVTDMAEYLKHGDLRFRYFGNPISASTTIEIKGLVHPDLMIETEVVAMI